MVEMNIAEILGRRAPVEGWRASRGAVEVSSDVLPFGFFFLCGDFTADLFSPRLEKMAAAWLPLLALLVKKISENSISPHTQPHPHLNCVILMVLSSDACPPPWS